MLPKMSRNNRLCLAVFLVATTLVATIDAATYTVGGNLGWRIPASGAGYDTFASQNSFVEGDVLVFNFPTGQHDVAPVTKEAYDACNASAAITLLTIGPASVTLTSGGTHYFICTFGQHCLAGQKLAVNVTASSSSPLPSPPPIPPQITPSPSRLPPSSAPPPSLLPETPSPSSMPPSQGPSPSGSAFPPSEGPGPSGSAIPPSEGPGPSGSDTPSSSSGSAPGSAPGEADGSVPPPAGSGSKTGVANLFVATFISAAVVFMF